MFNKNVIMPTVITAVALFVITLIPGVGPIVYNFLGAVILVAAVFIASLSLYAYKKNKEKLDNILSRLEEAEKNINNTENSL